MTAKIKVVINVVIKNFLPILGFFGAPGSIPPIFSLKASLFDRITKTRLIGAFTPTI